MKMIDKIREAGSFGNGEAGGGNVVYSLEFFPPKTEDGMDNLFELMERTVAHDTTFSDITWSANGSAADLSLEIANTMQNA